MPASITGGGSAYYLCDYSYALTTNGNILVGGSPWYYGLSAGPGCRYGISGPTTTIRVDGARIEYYPEDGEL